MPPPSPIAYKQAGNRSPATVLLKWRPRSRRVAAVSTCARSTIARDDARSTVTCQCRCKLASALPDAFDELPNGPLVDVRGELRAPQHQLELGEQERAGDDRDAVVDERSHHEVGVRHRGCR
jgi:hypothetical protein